MNKLLKLSTLVKLKGNPRTIKDSSFDKLCTSIKDNPEYFNARPIIVSIRTGENVIIAGNQRYEAARKLKLKEVPCYVMGGLTEDKEREIIIRDNVSNGDWDMELLANDWNLDDLVEWGLELPELAAETDLPDLKSGDKEPFQQKTFTLHDEQASIVDDAITKARTNVEIDTGLNENSNGNALAFICEQWLDNNG